MENKTFPARLDQIIEMKSVGSAGWRADGGTWKAPFEEVYMMISAGAATKVRLWIRS